MTTKTAIELRAAWYDALESGEFQQGKGGLAERHYNEDDEAYGEWQFCCLGVLCELAHRDGQLDMTSKAYSSFKEYKAPEDEYPVGGLPPRSFMESIGFDDNDPIVTINGVTREVSLHNDEGDHSFKEIAQALRERYPA